MEIHVEDLSPVMKQVVINIGAEKVNEKFDEFFGLIKKNLEMDGFRKGNVPDFIIRSKFSKEAKQTISKTLIAESYQSLMTDYDIVPIGNPEIENKDDVYGEFNGDNNFLARMKIEVLPKVDPVGYDNIDLSSVDKPDVDKIYEQRLSELQEKFAEKIQSDDPAEIGDSVVVDFKGYLDGIAFNGGAAEGHTIDKLGSSGLIPGFEENIIGTKAGEDKKFVVKFPDEYDFDLVAGKDVEFNLKVHTVIKSKKAAVDEDLALMAGHTTLDELYDFIKKESEQDVKNIFMSRAHGIIVEHLSKSNDFELPPTLFGDEVRRLTEQYKGLEADKIKEQATINCKKAIILEAIYDKEKLNVDPGKLDNYLEDQALKIGKSKDELVSLLNNTNQMDVFLGTLRTQETLEFLIEKNTKQEGEK